jgi:uncharacterized protein
VGLLAAGSLPATLLTVNLLLRLGAPSDSVSHMISEVLGLMLLLTTVSLVFRRQILAWAQSRAHQPTPRTAALLTILTGLVLGTLVSISSVGAGAIGVTVLIVLYPTLPTARIVGTDIAHAVPLTLVAGLGHWWLGSVDWHLFLSLVSGSIPGVILGSLIAARVSERFMRPALATILVIVGARLLS